MSSRGDPTALGTRELERRVRAGAGCRGTDTDAFYPGVGTTPRDVTDTSAQAEREHARALCTGCPVTAGCLELALRIPAGAHGIWGASTERDRRLMLPRRHATRRPQPVSVGDCDLAGVG
jgi:WhiB family redox-sensing transcriptional regulator